MTTSSPQSYRIHPALGVARLGDSQTEFSIAAETPASRPLACDSNGNPVLGPDKVTEQIDPTFKDVQGCIKRQAARFQVYVFDDESPEGRPLKIGDVIKGGGNSGTLVDIQWRVHLANKKAAWYQFKGLSGEHGYSDTHPLRNADIKDANERQQLIIDPGPRYVSNTAARRARFDRDGDGVYSATFPPKGMVPHDIDTLGEILTDDSNRLLVLGGHGKSGTTKKGMGQPLIDDYANTDGWFDDISDGPVMARLVMHSDLVGQDRYIDVEYPAWVIVGYPRYVPEILDLVTLDDVAQDLSVRRFAYRQDIYGVPGGYDGGKHIDPANADQLSHWRAGALDWNSDYKPWFYRDVWTILFRPDEMSYLNFVLSASNMPHNQSQRGTFDVTKLCVPPVVSRRVLDTLQKQIVAQNKSGELFESTLLTRLELFDDVIEQAVHRALKDEAAEPKPSPRRSLALAASPPRGGSQFTQLRQVRAALRAGVPQASSVEPVVARSVKLRAAKAGGESATLSLKGVAEVYAHKLVAADDSQEPAAYLAAWKTASELQESLNHSLQTDVEKVLAAFIETAISRWSDAAKKAGVPSSFFSGKDSQLTGIIADAVKAIANDVLSKFRTGQIMDAKFREAVKTATNDPYRDMRMFLYRLLRRPGEENAFTTAGKPDNRLFRLPLMPLLAGDNPTSNELPSKFLRLTDLQLFYLRQWAEGKFYNEVIEGWASDTDIDPFQPYKSWKNRTPRDLDQGVMANILGGAFFPGAEVCWIIRNPSIYKEAYRLKADPEFANFGQTAANNNRSGVTERDYLGNAEDPLSQGNNFEVGLQPGDLTKYSALPWQADFNECTMQTVDITDELWNVIDFDADHDVYLKERQKQWDTLWWPAHRPLQTYEAVFDDTGKVTGYVMRGWSRGVTQTLAGDLKMVTEWARLGFVVRNPYVKEEDLDQPSPDNKYVSVERNPDPIA